MNETRRVVPVLIAYGICALILAVIVVFNRPLPSVLLPPFVLAYRLRSIVLLFLEYLPSVYLSGLLVGFTLSFSKQSGENVGRWSGKLLSLLTSSFVIMLCVIAVYVVFAEGLAPVSRSRMDAAVSRSEDYHEYIRISRELLENDEPRRAEQRIQNALVIWKDGPEALQILDKCRYRAAEKYGPGAVVEADPLLDPLVPTEFHGMTVRSALDIAEKAAADHDYFDTHYYAMLAYRLSRPDDPHRDFSLRMASDAWNQIIQGTDQIESQDDAALYSAKRTAYNAIQQGDYLTAYYEFLDLHTADIARSDRKRDPDIERFLELSRKGVLETFFFLDETTQLRSFEAARDVFFVIKRPDGGTDAIHAAGVVYTRSGGRDVVYLRDFELVRHSQYHQLEYHIRVPYVKMFAYASDGKNARAELLLHSVDRNSGRQRQGPEVVAGTPREQDLSVLLLDMPYRDFSLVVAANRGSSSMNMVELGRFYDRAERYGFDPRVFLREVISRLSEPFLLLILSVAALIAGWKYRMKPGILFKAWWILMVPFFTVLTHLVIQSVRYLVVLCIHYFVVTAPALAMILTLVFLAICFTGVSLYFFSQRSD